MKKLFSLLLAAMLIFAAVFMLTVPALADTGGAADSPEFFTWAVLATYAGALAATLAITQLLKGVGFVAKIPTRIFSWIVAVIVLIVANYFIKPLNADTIGLCIINAVLVSLAANGGYDLIASAAKSTVKKNE